MESVSLFISVLLSSKKQRPRALSTGGWQEQSPRRSSEGKVRGICAEVKANRFEVVRDKVRRHIKVGGSKFRGQKSAVVRLARRRPEDRGQLRELAWVRSEGKVGDVCTSIPHAVMVISGHGVRDSSGSPQATVGAPCLNVPIGAVLQECDVMTYVRETCGCCGELA